MSKRAGMLKNIPDIVELGIYPESAMKALEEKIAAAPGWGHDRSAQYKVHGETKSLDVINAPLDKNFFNEIENGEYFETFREDVEALFELSKDRFGFVKPRIIRFLVVNLPAGEVIKPHRDFGPGLMVGVRMHLPIVTDEGVSFKVGETGAHLKRGHIYEINNSRFHSVKNESEKDRIHVIFDLCDMWHIEDQVAHVVVNRLNSQKQKDAEGKPAALQRLPSLKLCSGAIQERDSQAPLARHLFILCPNNSGSTLLSRYIGECDPVAPLPREGQFMKDFTGPNPIKLGVRHVFTEAEDKFRDDAAYDWDGIKACWYGAWEAKKSASIYLEKSPPNILRAELLKRHFPNVRFLLQVRNPYAMAEGVARRLETEDFERIGRHVFRVLRVQMENEARFKPISLMLRYEDICDAPEAAREKIVGFLPRLDGLDFTKVRKIKDYERPIENLNAQQIARLTPEAIEALNKSFDAEAMAHFGYERQG